MTIDLEQLRAVASDHHQAELALVHNARVAAMRSYNQHPGKETKANWDAAREAYSETIERLTTIYYPEQAQAPEGERFTNRKQALNWLQAQGYKVSQGKFYGDCAAGFPAIHKDGTVSRYQVLQYAQQQDVERRGSDRPSSREEDEDRKIKADADRSEMQTETMRRELDREWLHADQAWAAIAALVGVIGDALKYEFFKAQGELIHLAGGDVNHGPIVYELCETVIERAMTHAAKMGTVEVAFAGDEEDA